MDVIQLVMYTGETPGQYRTPPPKKKGICDMRDWNKFYGCVPLSVNECIEFLKHLEISGRIDTKEGAFLHNQYMRELMRKKGISIRTMDPRHGSLSYYNLQYLKNKYDKVNTNMQLGMCKGYALLSIKADIEAVKDPYVQLNMNGLQATVDSVNKILLDAEFIKSVVSIIVNNKYSILLAGSDNLLNKTYKDDSITYDISLKKILRRWCNGEVIEKHVCGNDVYIYGIRSIHNLSFKYYWVGYCESCGVVNGESKTGSSWINKEKREHEI